MKTLVSAVLVCLATTAHADAPHHYIGADPLGGLGFMRLNVGRFAVHYEHLLTDHLGLRVAGDLVHVHQGADYQQVHQWTFGGSLALRYYPGAIDGAFVGLGVGYRRGFGHFGEEGEPDFVELENHQLAIVPQTGVRFWFPELSLAITSSIGVGYGPYTVEASNRDDQLGRDAARTARDILGATPLTLELELSFAFGF